MLALAHRHRHLDHPQLVPDRHHEPLDLRVVVRVGRRRTARIARRLCAWKPDVVSVTRCVGDPRDDAREDPDARRGGRRRTCSRRPERKREPIARSASSATTGATTRAELRRVVLAVAVEPDGQLVAAFPGVAEAGLDGAADAEVEGQLDDVGAGGGGDLGRAVGRAVGDDDDLERRGRARAARRAAARGSSPRCTPGRSRSGGRSRAALPPAWSRPPRPFRPQSTCAFTLRSSRSSSRRARWR